MELERGQVAKAERLVGGGTGEQLGPEGEEENPGDAEPRVLQPGWDRPLETGDLTAGTSPSQPARQERRHSFSSASRPHDGSLLRARQRLEVCDAALRCSSGPSAGRSARNWASTCRATSTASARHSGHGLRRADPGHPRPA